MDWLFNDLINSLKDLKNEYNKGISLDKTEIEYLLHATNKIEQMKKNKKDMLTWNESFRKAMIISLPQIMLFTTIIEES
jgi:hypothetical protein